MQTALRTKEVANQTLEELQRQGQKLNVIQNDLNEVWWLACGRACGACSILQTLTCLVRPADRCGRQRGQGHPGLHAALLPVLPVRLLLRLRPLEAGGRHAQRARPDVRRLCLSAAELVLPDLS